MDMIDLFKGLAAAQAGEGSRETRIETLGEAQRQLVTMIRDEIARGERLGPVSHALNVAATHAQDAFAELRVAGDGGSPGVR